ncbi:EAL and HDOD domain-containing protein [Nitrincola tapanii]|uniref:HDOD domain-containing protein n=1 Tax=Nitrincola tapanii TaxID=1708751 RepID=A0A5A9W5L1_9GAMM|nr:HDOD domain-containing protein [Nitrincola tapanii]KAA0875378.1 HDOD domain-containing protein [Nitrincola tapanii]
MSPSSHILLARQPIFDQHQKVIAYALLSSDADVSRLVAPSPDEDSLSSAMLLDAYTSISDQGEVKKVAAFLPISLSLLLKTGLPSLPKKQVVLDISLRGFDLNSAGKILVPLIKEGYRLCLSDIPDPQLFAPLLKHAYILKVAVRGLNNQEILEASRPYWEFKRPMLASGIDDYAALETCIEQHFRLFQGNFLSQPRAIKGQKAKANQLIMLQLIQSLHDPNVSPETLEKLIIQDPVLTYKLLRIVNSAAYALVREIESIAQAVVLLGLEQVRKWATVISLDAQSGKPEELTRTLLTRGHMCELIAQKQRRPNAAAYFMAGMMSGIHLLLDLDKDSMLEQLPLAEDIIQALAEGTGPMGELLTQVMAYESGDWDLLPTDFNAALFEQTYRESLKWTQESMQALNE